MNKGKLKQILLLTDGCSNVGSDPVAVANMAAEYGITVNVIGIVDDDSFGEQGIQEIKEIALAGKGVHQMAHSKHLPRTVQMVTRKAMTQTIHQVVNKELQHILGQEDVQSLPPQKRGQVVEVVEDLGETMAVDVLVLVDVSASMAHKLPAVKQSLRDLSLSMQARVGDHRFSLWTYPCTGKQPNAYKHMDWSDDFHSIEKTLARISPQGTTPTGPALEEAIRYFTGKDIGGSEEEGVFRDYVY
ncbi:VWA domain-containing protein [Caldalkalibacillus salinus]|uniref:VWA domain-containing protein n=1 Tax=Caldalkalibacillus salinus TaxID=2803787 RepID=UPI001921D86F|nr:VWA domain-containing protein [Caldalkalibacillus salinus]